MSNFFIHFSRHLLGQTQNFRLVLLAFCSFYCLTASGQYDPANNAKYDHYRARFDQYYVVVGPDKGESIPFSTRRYVEKVHEIRSGESTFMLGNYLAVLALEYQRSKFDGKDLGKLKKELFYAMTAVNRLDYYAETYDKSGNYAPELNGFFVREDIPQGFLKKHQDHLNARLNTIEKSEYYVRGKATILPISKNREENPPERPTLPHRNMSQDHAIRLMWGLYLVHHFVDDKAHYVNQTFLDGEKQLRIEAKNIILRMIDHFEKNKWRITRPNGEKVRRGAQVYIFKKELSRLKKNLQKDGRGLKKKKMSFSYGFFNKGVFGLKNANAWMNGRMQMETQNLSGNSYRAWNRCYDFGYEPYFIPYGILVHNWPIREDRKAELKKIMEFYLNMAPCEGNFYHSDGDFSSYGWATPDRTERPLEDTYFGIFEKGNYSGLDFMLMFNLYDLLYRNETKNHSKKNTPCNLDCNYLNRDILDQEMKRVLKSMKKSLVKEKQAIIERLESACQ